MPHIQANGISMHYERQGDGEPLVLLPYLAADHMCYAFQVQEYARHFSCYSLDLRGTGSSDKPADAYTTEQLADDVAAFMLTSTRFAEPLTQGIRRSELLVLEDCAHGLLYERVEEFNQRTLDFLQRHSGTAVV